MRPTKNPTNEKQIVFRVSELVHRQIRIQAAEQGAKSTNQFAKEKLLETLGLTEKDLQEPS